MLSLTNISQNVQDKREERKNEIEVMLKEHSNVDPSVIEGSVEIITNKENQFYQSITNLVGDDISKNIENLPIMISELFEAYTIFTPKAKVEIESKVESESDETAENDKEKFQELKEQQPEVAADDSTLVAELDKANVKYNALTEIHEKSMYALNIVFSEYASMVGIETGGKKEFDLEFILEAINSTDIKQSDKEDEVSAEKADAVQEGDAVQEADDEQQDDAEKAA